MSGGTPTQNLVLFTVIGLVVVLVVVTVVLGRLRRRRAVGSAEAGSVRSAAQAKEIADRLYSYCSRSGGSAGDPGRSDRVQVRVRGAARLLKALSADDRFEVTPRAAGDEYWAFTVDGRDLGRGVVDILARNGVTAVAE